MTSETLNRMSTLLGMTIPRKRAFVERLVPVLIRQEGDEKAAVARAADLLLRLGYIDLELLGT